MLRQDDTPTQCIRDGRRWRRPRNATVTIRRRGGNMGQHHGRLRSSHDCTTTIRTGTYSKNSTTSQKNSQRSKEAFEQMPSTISEVETTEHIRQTGTKTAGYSHHGQKRPNTTDTENTTIIIHWWRRRNKPRTNVRTKTQHSQEMRQRRMQQSETIAHTSRKSKVSRCWILQESCWWSPNRPHQMRPWRCRIHRRTQPSTRQLQQGVSPSLHWIANPSQPRRQQTEQQQQQKGIRPWCKT